MRWVNGKNGTRFVVDDTIMVVSYPSGEAADEDMFQLQQKGVEVVGVDQAGRIEVTYDLTNVLVRR